MAEEEIKGIPDEELNKLTDEEIERIMEIRQRRLVRARVQKFIQAVAVCTKCGAFIDQATYDGWETAGCPYCGGDRAVPLNLEASGAGAEVTKT